MHPRVLVRQSIRSRSPGAIKGSPLGVGGHEALSCLCGASRPGTGESGRRGGGCCLRASLERHKAQRLSVAGPAPKAFAHTRTPHPLASIHFGAAREAEDGQAPEENKLLLIFMRLHVVKSA